MPRRTLKSLRKRIQLQLGENPLDDKKTAKMLRIERQTGIAIEVILSNFEIRVETLAVQLKVTKGCITKWRQKLGIVGGNNGRD